jgi:hypothetical protein
MGIYPDYYTEPADTKTAHEWYEYRSIPGVVSRRRVVATNWEEYQRNNCFCCSCEDFSCDPYCRNHGWYGTRPCEVHGMPGEAGDDGVMPAGVQVVWASRRPGG